MSTTTFKRYMIHQDNDLLKDIVSDLRHFNKPLTALKEAYEALELEDVFDYGVFEFIKGSGVDQIIDKYLQILHDGLAATGVKHSKLKSFVLEGSEVPIEKLRSAHRQLKQFACPAPNSTLLRFHTARTNMLTLEYITFDGSKFLVTDHDQEKILEKYCRIYIEDEQQDSIYKNLSALRSEFIKYERWITALGLERSIYGGNYSDRLDEFFSYNRETKDLQIKPASIAWAQGLKAYRERMQNR